MKILRWMKDGGPESRVSGLFVVEVKRLFSIVLLRFDDGSRPAYHSHAFNAVSWVLRGRLEEHVLTHLWGWHGPTGPIYTYGPSPLPVITRRSRFHQVRSLGTTWVLSFRGPWADTWQEYIPIEDRFLLLSHGRKAI